MAEKKVVTGVEVANVNIKEQKDLSTVTVRKGQALPDNLADGEVERLEKLGVFEETTHAERVRARAAHARAWREGLAPDTSGKVNPVVNRPETPHIDRPPGGTLAVSALTTPVTPHEAEGMGQLDPDIIDVSRSVDEKGLSQEDQDALNNPEKSAKESAGPNVESKPLEASKGGKSKSSSK
jgi:hypothetical protein